MKKLYLICNAHIDPMWLWNWEEGAAAALSTFRSAVTFCEEYDTFVFNHNEALLYRWIEQYDPETFERIRRQIERGRWKIMGGWYLQPDCNMPSGEAFIRQIRAGNKYFKEKFGKTGFETAVNFDSFGHSRGLVQILNKCGYKYYITARPGRDRRPDLPEFFKWNGFCGSHVYVSKSDLYNSPLGHVDAHIASELPKKQNEVNVLLWGVGNHGGGPSRADIEKVEEFIRSDSGFEGVQSDPDSFFHEAERKNKNVLEVSDYLGTVFPGVFTSQMRVKQRYRQLEAELFSAEKMVSVAQLCGDMSKDDIPGLQAAQEDMLFCQFHDVLPGTGIPSVEESALKKLAHGLEEVSRVRANAFFAMLRKEKAAASGEYPVFAFNPHPYPIQTAITCEVQLADQNWTETSTYFKVKDGETELPSQVEKEACNLNLDWRKRVTFLATLRPLQMNRFDLTPYIGAKREYAPQGVGKDFTFSNKYYSVTVGGSSGLIESFTFGKQQMLRAPVRPVVTKDSEDSWIMRYPQYENQQEIVGGFVPVTETGFDGTAQKLPTVHIIENGDVRTVVETALAFEDCKMRIQYVFYRDLPYYDMDFEIHWRRKDGCLKVVFDTIKGTPFAETAFGREQLKADGSEQPIQRWIAMRSENSVFAVFNRGSYGASCTETRISQTLLRSPAYSGHSIADRPILPQDRITSRMDNGVRTASLRVQAGNAEFGDTLSASAAIYQCAPFALQAFPGGKGEAKEYSGITVDDPAIEMTAFCRRNDKNGWLMRLFNGAEEVKKANIKVSGQTFAMEFEPQEVKNCIVCDNGTVIFEDELI